MKIVCNSCFIYKMCFAYLLQWGRKSHTVYMCSVCNRYLNPLQRNQRVYTSSSCLDILEISKCYVYLHVEQQYYEQKTTAVYHIMGVVGSRLEPWLCNTCIRVWYGERNQFYMQYQSTVYT